MKISFLTKSVGYGAGGILPVIQELGTRLVNCHGVGLQVVGLEDTSEEVADSWGKIDVTRCQWYGPHLFGYSPQMKAIVQSFGPDLVHTHGLFYYTSIVAVSLNKSRRIPYLVSPHGMLDPWALANGRLKKKLGMVLFEKRHLHNASCIHSLGYGETKAMRSLGLKKPICQIPNGVTIKDPMIHASVTSSRHGFAKDKRVLLFLGRIHPKKGLQSLISAWGKIPANERKEWILVIAGWDQGGHEEVLKKHRKCLGPNSGIEFIGPQFGINKDSTLQCADAFILPSLSEGLPMTVLEAWANKLPVLMTAQCNLPEGFVANAALEVFANEIDIEKKLRVLFTMSEADRARMGQRGFDLVKSKFSWEIIARDMCMAYQWILGGGSPPSCIVT